MEGLITFIFSVVAAYYILRLLARLYFRRQIKKYNRRMEQDGYGTAGDGMQKEKKPHINPDIGEYTDFEEIEQP